VTPRRSLGWVGLLLLAAGCGNLQGLGGGGPSPALVTFQVEATDALGLVSPPGGTSVSSLQIAIVWGAQWLPEPFCILPPESNDAAAVIAAGCRDPFGFVPARAAESVPVTVGTEEALSLANLPAVDLLVGGVTSRVGYASFVLYDDRDGSGTLGLSTAHSAAFGGRGPDQQDNPDSADVIYGASFLTMTAPDVRVSYLEGTFMQSGFYPRSGCPGPDQPFQILSAGGFTEAAAVAATLMGALPAEDPNSCNSVPPDKTVVQVGAQVPADVGEVSCSEDTLDGSTRYRQPPDSPPDLAGRVSACAHLPSFDPGSQLNLIQLVVSGRPEDHCKGLTHYTLRGCRENVDCAVPDWDFTANPPAWWPCPTS
jgi:hypothetical protein